MCFYRLIIPIERLLLRVNFYLNELISMFCSKLRKSHRFIVELNSILFCFPLTRKLYQRCYTILIPRGVLNLSYLIFCIRLPIIFFKYHICSFLILEKEKPPCHLFKVTFPRSPLGLQVLSSIYHSINEPSLAYLETAQEGIL